MTLIEVNPDSKTAPQDRSCEAASFYHDGIIFRGGKKCHLLRQRIVFFIRVEVDGDLF